MELQWPLILFTFFVCLSAGILLVQGILTALDKGKELQFTSLVASAVSLVIGGIAVFTHLQHWERIFNGFGHITSGITQELIGVVLMAVVIILYYLMMRRSEDGQAPKWVGIVAAVVAVVMVVLMAHSYSMAARPAWNTFILIVYYLINMGLLGSLAVLLLAAWRKVSDSFGILVNLAIVFAILQIIVLVAYAFIIQGSGFPDHGYYFDPTIPDIAVVNTDALMTSVMSGDLALAFWGGAVVCGAVVPAVLAFLARGKGEGKEGTVLLYAAIALVGAIVGALCWRGILYVVAATVFAIF